jgi:hypothetical protein
MLNEEFNDKGMIFLRHGEADGVHKSMGSQNLQESWVYEQTPDEPMRIFHFIAKNSSTNNWRLVSIPTDTSLLADLALIDKRYRDLAMSQTGDVMKYSDAISFESQAAVEEALSTDTHTWGRETKTFKVPFSVDSFRHESGKTQIDIPYAIPLDALRDELPESDLITVEVGLALSKASGDTAMSRLDTLRIPSSHAEAGSYIGMYRFRVQPDSLRIAMAVRPLGTHSIGNWSRTLRIPAFRSKEMMLSSIQFLLPSDQEMSIEIDGIKVIQSPFEIVPSDRPFYVYLQIYNLVKDMSGKTRYTARYTVNPGPVPSDNNATVLLEKDVEGNEEMGAEFRGLDLSGLSEGVYTLKVSVTDRKRVQTLVRTRTIEIVKP